MSKSVEDLEPVGGISDITACEREPIHVPGAIQPHGLLLIIDPVSLEIVAGAGDIESRLDPDWLGRTANSVLGSAIELQVHTLTTGAAVSVALGRIRGRAGDFRGFARLSSGWLVIELEPATQTLSSYDRLLALTSASASFERTIDLKALCDAAAVAFQDFTGFNRVMIYRFLDDEAGVVVAEAHGDDIGSFLHHHFPASDIPAQARQLYIRNRIRVIPDINYEPAPLRPGTSWNTLDMSDVALRSVSPIHIQYMKNMGVGASASISIVKDNVLWGLIACHNRLPRQLNPETRLACTTLAADLSRQITAKDDAEIYRLRIRLRAQEDAIISHLGDIGSLKQFLAGTGDELCRMFGADGFAALKVDEVFTAGRCPGEADILLVADWVKLRANAQPFFTNSLSTEFAEALPFTKRASGLLAVTMSADVPTILMWFRAEQLETVNWAGNPHKPVLERVVQALTPRASFNAWSETVEGQAKAWSLGEVEAANRLQRRMLEVRQVHRLRALNLELGKTVNDKDNLLLQKDFLIKEVNHRVQNSLSLVSAFLGLQSRESDNDLLKLQLAEAQRRLSAVALVHRRLYSGDQVQTIDLSRYLEDLCTEVKTSMGEEWSGLITFDLSPVLVATDRAVNIGLILTELIINANKYAYAGQPGPISISLRHVRNSFSLIVADKGAGKIANREGFGTRMLNAMIGSLNGKLDETSAEPGLCVTVTAPVQGRGEESERESMIH
jgi:chemotaxis family two-component system sensor kinase Cph1